MRKNYILGVVIGILFFIPIVVHATGLFDTPSIVLYDKYDSSITIEVSEKEIDTYLSTEPSVEYYRYIFEKDKKDLCLKNPVIKLDFNNVKKIFKNVLNHFDELCKQLKKIMYIIYSF